MRHFDKNLSSGFSLISLLVAVGVMSVLTLTIITMMDMTFRNQRTAMANIEAQNVTGAIQQILSHQEPCSKTFAGLDLDTANNVPMIKDKDGNPTIYKVYSTEPNGAVAYISSMTLARKSGGVSIDPSIIEGSLMVQLRKTGKVIGSEIIMPFKDGLSVFFRVNPDNTIASCAREPEEAPEEESGCPLAKIGQPDGWPAIINCKDSNNMDVRGFQYSGADGARVFYRSIDGLIYLRFDTIGNEVNPNVGAPARGDCQDADIADLILPDSGGMCRAF